MNVSISNVLVFLLEHLPENKSFILENTRSQLAEAEGIEKNCLGIIESAGNLDKNCFQKNCFFF